MDIIAAISTITNAMNIAKTMRQIEKDYDAATLKMQLADIGCALADAKIALTDAAEENNRLKAEITRILTAEDEIATLVDVSGYKFHRDENGIAIGWPACPSCLDKEKRISILVRQGPYNSGKCPRCNSEFRPVTSFVAPGLTLAEQISNNRNAARNTSIPSTNGWMSR